MYTDSATARNELNDLLRQCGRGDRVAFSELYKRSSSKLFSTCFCILRQRSESEDALQDIYVLIWRQASEFDASRGSAMTWLLAITRNKAIDRLRRRANLPASIHYQEQATAPESSPSDQAEAMQESRNLSRCLSQLKPEHERSLREAFFSGASYRELARTRNVPEGTMKAQIRRSLRTLRTSLEHLEGSETGER